MEHANATDLKYNTKAQEAQSKQSQLDSIRDEIVELRRKEAQFKETQGERMEMRVALDETDLKYRKKFDECLKLEKQNTFIGTENDLLKDEIIDLTQMRTDFTEKVKHLSTVNENNFKKITELNTNAEHLTHKI